MSLDLEAVAQWFQIAHNRCVETGRVDSAALWSDGLQHLRAMASERDALTERVEKLHEALREMAVREFNWLDGTGCIQRVRCHKCGNTWPSGGTELHNDGCLAAPSAP